MPPKKGAVADEAPAEPETPLGQREDEVVELYESSGSQALAAANVLLATNPKSALGNLVKLKCFIDTNRLNDAFFLSGDLLQIEEPENDPPPEPPAEPEEGDAEEGEGEEPAPPVEVKTWNHKSRWRSALTEGAALRAKVLLKLELWEEAKTQLEDAIDRRGEEEEEEDELQMMWSTVSEVIRFEGMNSTYEWVEPKLVYDMDPAPRSGHSSALCDGMLYIYGGWDTQYRGDVCVLDTNEMVWIEHRVAGQEPEPRCGHVASFIGKKMIVFGGETTLYGERVKVDEVLCLDTSKKVDTWSTVECVDTPSPRSYSASVNIGDKIFIFGGSGDNGVVLNDLYTLELNVMTEPNEEEGTAEVQEINKWTLIETTGNKPEARAYHAMCVLSKRWIAVFGGRASNGKLLNDFHILDTETNEWLRVPLNDDVPSPRCWHGMASVDSKVIIFGGFANGCLSNDFYCVDTHYFKKSLPSKVVDAEPEAEDPKAAKGKEPPKGKGKDETIEAPKMESYLDGYSVSRMEFIGWTPEERQAHTFVSLGNKFLVFGGWNGIGRMNDVHCLSHIAVPEERYMARQIYANQDKYEGHFDDVRSGHGVCEYDNGDRYEGMWVNDKRCGPGEMVYADSGDKYVGEWNNDMRNGQGVCTYGNGDIYEGSWVNNQRTGEGKCSYSNGDVYEGQWSNDRRHGEGHCKYSDGDRYTGQWEDDQRHGTGRVDFKLGGHYEGDFKQDKRNGVGYCQYRNGDRYEGKWKNGVRFGKGTIVFGSGDTYTGTFVDGWQGGFGECIYANTNRYEGEWRKGIREGRGTCYYANGDRYEGEWVRDMRDGRGTLFRADGTKYAGWWKNDVREGRGEELLEPDGREWREKYFGEMVNNLRHGRGTYVYENGDEYTGEWCRDERSGQGKCRYSDGSIYEGEWKNDMRCGHGTLRDEGGYLFEGRWRNDKQHGHGRCTWSNGDRYEGSWRNGGRTGKAECFYSNGDYYKGDWLNDRRHGDGKAVFANGDVYEGRWEDDRRVNPPEEMRVTLTAESYASQLSSGDEFRKSRGSTRGSRRGSPNNARISQGLGRTEPQ